MERARLGRDGIGLLAAGRGVDGIAVEDLNLDLDAVVYQRIDEVVEFLGTGQHAALLLDPIPTGAVGTIFVLPDANPFEARVKHARPPPAIPRQIRLAR